MAVEQQTRPAWARRLDLGLLVTLGLCLFAWWPVLANGGLPEGHDTLFHLQRAAEMNRSWSHGVLLPHWAESFYYGYGSPVFHYYAGLSYYATSLLQRVLGLGTLDSIRALILLALPGAGVGMYLLLRQRWGRAAGMIAAVCFVYSPYILYREPYVRGDYPELLAFALFPWVMWRFERLALTGRGRDLVLAAGFLGVFILAHNLMAAALFGLLAGWIVWGRLVGVLDWRRFGLLAGAAALGLLLAAHFWMPVLLERGAVHLDRLIAIPSLDYRNSFVPLREMLAAVPRTDTGTINGLRAISPLGVAQWVLALAGTVTAVIGAGLVARRQGGRAIPADLSMTLAFAVAALALIALMLPAAAGLWDAFDPLAYLQFPWRLLGPVAFCLAVLAGLNARWIARLPGWGGATVFVLLLVVPVVLSMPLWKISEAWRLAGVDTSVRGYHALEVSGEMPDGTTVTNEFLPTDVYVIPDPTDRLLADYADGYPVDKAHRDILPDSAALTLVDHGPEHDEWRVESPDGLTLEVLTFYFAGWTARIDGEKTPITPSQPHGLITFDVPPGVHTIRLALERTPARWLADGLSWTALVGTVAAGVVIGRRRRAEREGTAPTPPPGSTTPWTPVAGAAALVLIAGLALIFMREGGAWVHSPPGEAKLASHVVDVRLGDSVTLIGYDLEGAATPGGRLDVTLYWYTSEPIGEDLNSFLHFSTGGPPLAQVDKQNPGDLVEWSIGGFIRDEYVLQLPDALVPGDYQLRAGLWSCPSGDCPDGGRLQVTDADGEPLGDSVLLRTITVR